MQAKEIKIYADGGARGNPGPAASAFLAMKEDEVIHKESSFLGKTTNNVAEYKAVILALRWLDKYNDISTSYKVRFYLDSELIVNQIKGKYKIKSKRLKPMLAEVKNLEDKISNKINEKSKQSSVLTYHSIPRSQNKLADHLVNKVLDSSENVQ